jgi:hypothetical protein
MADRMTVDADATALLAALATVPDAVQVALKGAAKVTAEAIALEARARVKRRTGRTGEAITVEETRNGDGYVVFVGSDRGHVGSFLEFGTKFMTSRPFLFVSARLEESAHNARARDAVQTAINLTGLGD